MLQDIRDNAQSTIAKVIVGLVIISLSIWGMDAIIGGFSGEPEVATVNGQDITEREFLRTVQMETQQRLMAMDNPDPSLVDEDQVRSDVMEALITEAVLSQDAENQGLELTEADIDSLITQMPQFQVDGQFNSDRFVSTVRNMGMGVAEFRQNMRKNYVVSQIRAALAQTGVVPAQNVAQLLEIQNQTRDFRVLTLTRDAVADDVEVTEQQVQDYYQDNQEQFQEPEQVDAAYITLSLDALAANVEVSEEDVQQYYQEQAQSFAREERRAAHILVEAGDDAQQTISTIQQKLDEGESFETLAQEYSADPGSADQGGDLGYAGRGVYDPAFEEALFSLDKGEISGPVETSFGIHLIKLEDVRRSDVPSFDELRDQLREELARNRAEERFAEVRSQLADAAYSAEDLAGPAEELGLEVQEIQGVTRERGAAPFDHQGLVRQLFSEDVLEAGYNTELIDVADNRSVVARVREYHEPRQLELAEVSDRIRRTLEAQAIRDALNERAEAIVTAVEAGEQPMAGDWQVYEGQGRTGGLDPLIAQKAFSMPRSDGDDATVGKVVAQNRAAVVQLEAVHEGEVDPDGQEFTQLRQILAQMEGQREYRAYQQYLRNTAEIERQ